MTAQESISIEDRLIKISVRTLWALVAAVVFGVWVAAGFFSDLKYTQERILNEVIKARTDFQYQIKDVQKDIQGHELRITELESHKHDKSRGSE